MLTKTTLLLSCAAVLTPAAFAQTWVSAAVGSDSNNCSRTTPCRTFAHAVTMTPVWGQVSVVDPGDYGSVTLSQSITIDGGNMVTNVTQSGTSITVQAGTGIVQLRNMSLHGNGATTGINYVSGGQLVVENVKVNGYGGFCVNVGLSGSGTSDFVIKDSSIDNCSSVGIGIYGTPSLTAEIIDTQVHFANNGLQVVNGNVTVNGSTFSSPSTGGSGSGIITGTASSGTPPFLMIDNCQVSGFGVGVLVNAGGTVQLSRSNISYTSTALFAVAGGSNAQLISNGNNSFLNNTSLGAFTKTVALQ
jgi:hypothetical protein